MAQYYYLIATLPALTLDAKPPITLSEFLQACEQHLTPDEYSRIRTIIFNEGLESESVQGVFGRWVQFNNRFRNQLAAFRARKFNKDMNPYIRGSFAEDYYINAIILEASKAENPLAVEKALDRARWTFLDELSSGYYFEFEAVMIYALRLQMLERYSDINSPKGKELFQQYKKIDIPAIN